ncbi:MAG: chemotaxis protein CheA [Alphaproteobacteria bacterium]
MDDLLLEFLTETFENLELVNQELVSFERNPNDKVALGKIFRLIHTVKGTCGFLNLSRLEKLTHAAETMLGQFRDGTAAVTADAVSLTLRSIDRLKLILVGLEKAGAEPPGDDRYLIEALKMVGSAPASQIAQAPAEIGEVEDGVHAEPLVASKSIRVDVDHLERMMMLVSELVLARNQLMQMVRRDESSEYKVPLQRVSNITSDLQDSVMKARMQPVRAAWAKLPRLVRDLANELGKKIDLSMTGGESEIDRQVLELIKAPLMHMVRNAADHGLETPNARRAAGKGETGIISLNAYHEGGHIIIEIGDDGRGLNTQRIREKILREGLATEAELGRLSEKQVQQYIFHAGFSTADQLTNISGRGVGLDVVRANIAQIGGTVDLKSTAGSGAVFAIKIPLTLTIVSTLIVEVAGQRFAVPQVAVVELVRAGARTQNKIELIHNSPVLKLRDRLVQLVRLDEALQMRRTDALDPAAEELVVIVEAGARVFGVIVDRVLDTEEIVVKPMASVLRHIAAFSGNTILGDGSVAMIVDPRGLALGIAEGATALSQKSQAAELVPEEADDKTAILIFKAGGGEYKGVPLSLVTRLEELDVARFEQCDGRHIVQYRGRMMPIIHVDPGTTLKDRGRQPILVYASDTYAAGLAVDEIIDITEEKLEIELRSQRPGVLGSALVKGHATEIIDAQYFISQIHEDWLLAKLDSAARALKGAAA